MTSLSISRVALISGFSVLALGACSERYDAPTPPGGGGGGGGGNATEIAISNFAFTAPTVTIDRGTTVRWRNTTGTFHTVTPDGHQAFTERQTNASGETIDVRFDAAGTYRYYCAPHRALGMTGQVIVR